MANKDGDRKLYISIALKIFSEFNKRKQKRLSEYVSWAKLVKLNQGRHDTGQKLAGCPGRAFTTPVILP